MAKKTEKLSRIRSGVLERGATLAKMSLAAGTRWTEVQLGNLFRGEEARTKEIEKFLLQQVESLTNELGLLKGSLMKVGQLLSTFGEHFLPEKANAILKKLQCETPPIDWPAMEAALTEALGPDLLARLEVEHEALASASLGQVHRARILATGEEIALKIQYPGVARAIDSDLRALRSLLSMARLLPRQLDTDAFFAEVRDMLIQELDYLKELSFANEYGARLDNRPEFAVPRTHREFSSHTVLATDFMPGVALDGPEIKALPQERRNRLAALLLELLFMELFDWGLVQTDPHFGNYRVQLDPAGDRIVLLDFGALRRVTPEFMSLYRDIVQGGLAADREQVMGAALRLGLLRDDDPAELQKDAYSLVRTVLRPFLLPDQAPDDPSSQADGTYDWGTSRLPEEVLKKGYNLVRNSGRGARKPPRELVFLDRKVSGTFTAIARLGAVLDGRKILLPFVSGTQPSAE